MSSIVTFLGKGGTGRTTIAIATAKNLAQQGRKVLLLTQDSGPTYKVILGLDLQTKPQEIAANLAVAGLSSTDLLNESWEQVKKLEQEYLRSPLLKNVYGQELGVLPGMDQALALNKLRELDQSKEYDVIVYDGSGDLNTLRMFGMPEVLDWYIRRFKNVFQESDVVQVLSPFVQPVTSAILNVSWSSDNFANEEGNQASQMLDKGKQAISDRRVFAYLVTTADPVAIAQAKYLWGSAQQVGLTIGGVLLNQSDNTSALSSEFETLPITSLPTMAAGEWQTVGDAMPSINVDSSIPQPTNFEMSEKKIKVFLPGFAKEQVKLTQNGSDITIEAGDQRRNIALPSAWSGRSVTGAKFINNYLELSIG